MNLKKLAMLSVFTCVLGAGLAPSSAYAAGPVPAGIQVECDDVYQLCIWMGYDAEYCSELAIRMCSVGDDDVDEP